MNAHPRLPRRRHVLQVAGAAAAQVAAPAWAQALFGRGVIRLVVAQPPGDAADLVARAVAEPLAKSLGQSVMVENRPGAAGATGAASVASAAPDALTLLLAQTQALAVAPFAADRQPYDPLEGFTHVAGLAAVPCVLLSPLQANLTSLSDLEARARKGPLPFASPAPLSLGHVYGELLKQSLKWSLVHAVPRAPTLARELAGGAPPLAIDLVGTYAPLVQGGQLNGVVVTSAERCALVPDVPSIADFGHANLVLDSLFGLSAPARLPSGHVARLTAACQAALAQPDVQKTLASLGARPLAPQGGAFTALVKQQIALLGPVVRAAGLRP